MLTLLQESKKKIFISPHADDIAYSIGGLLSMFDFSNSYLITVFSKSNYIANKDDLSKNEIEEISKIRKIEENQFCREKNLKCIALGFMDSSARGVKREDVAKLNQIDENFILRVGESILSEVNLLKEGLIFCPLAIGNHVDHYIVYNSLKKLVSSSTDYKIIYFEDIPYASWFDEDYILQIIYERINNPIKIKVPVRTFIKEKLKLMKIYKSQTRQKELNSALSYLERLDYRERLWLDNKS